PLQSDAYVPARRCVDDGRADGSGDSPRRLDVTANLQDVRPVVVADEERALFAPVAHHHWHAILTSDHDCHVRPRRCASVDDAVALPHVLDLLHRLAVLQHGAGVSGGPVEAVHAVLELEALVEAVPETPGGVGRAIRVVRELPLGRDTLVPDPV